MLVRMQLLWGKIKKIEMSPPPLHLRQIFSKTHGFPWDVSLGTSFSSGENSLETEIKFSKFENSVILKGFFQLLEIRQRKEKNRQISILVFSFIATITTEGLLKMCTSYWVYNQICLNNRGDDHHLFYIFISSYGWSPLKVRKKIL
jgi:hypothetical protein